MAARPTWSGTVSFALLAIPVKLYTATRSKDISFNQIEKSTGGRIKQKRVSATTGEELTADDIVKGYDLGGDRYVTIDPDELEALAPTDRNNEKTIQILDFVDMIFMIEKRFGVTVKPAPDFVVYDTRTDDLRAMLECKGANDGGTARDKAARFGNLRTEANRLGGVPLFAVLGGIGWRRTSDALGPVVKATDGRVFTIATLPEMLTVEPFPGLMGTAPSEESSEPTPDS